MAYTETTTTGWGSRMMNSIKGVLVGGFLFLIAFPVLFMNEGCAVKQYATVGEAKQVTVEASSDKVDPSFEKKLVHMEGNAKTDEVLEDPTFKVKATAISLRRATEMYQWEEDKDTKTTKNVGGSETTKTTYTYKKVWAEGVINSESFKDPDHPNNPTSIPFEAHSEQAKVVTFGAFKLSQSLISQITSSAKLPVTAETLEALPEDLRAKYPNLQVYEQEFYLGKDPAKPEIGDVKISFTEVRPAEVSILAVQTGDTFEEFKAKTGMTFDRLQLGKVTAEEMYKAKEGEIAMMTWFIRGGGFFLMFIGLSMILGPLGVAGDVVPFIGSILRFGAGLVAGILAAIFSLITIAVAWIFYRPVLGITLLVIAVGLIVLIVMMSKKKAPAAV